MAEQIVLDPGPKTKVCGTCKQHLPISEFHKKQGKHRSNCKTCHAAYTRHWYVNNKEKRRAYYQGYAAKNVDKLRGYRAKSADKLKLDPDWVARRKAWSDQWHLKRKYNLTLEQWRALHDAQGGLCVLCKKRGNGRGKNGRLYVDHCHDTGRVRGLLCRHCNTALGILGDSPEKMEMVMSYLRGPSQ